MTTHHFKNKIWWSKEASLGWRVELFSSLEICRKKLDYLHLKDFLEYEREWCLKQPLALPQHTAYCSLLPTAPRTIDLPLKVDDGWLSLSLEILDYATFAPTK